MFSLSHDTDVPFEAYEFLFKNLPSEGSLQTEVLESSLELIDGYMNGKINTKYEFNAVGYVRAIKKHKTMEKSREYQKQLYIYNSDEDFDPNDRAGISVAVLQDPQDEYLLLEEQDEVQYAITKYKSLQDGYCFSEGCDILVVLKNAIDGIPMAVKKLKELCETDSIISNLVWILLSSGLSYSEMFPV